MIAALVAAMLAQAAAPAAACTLCDAQRLAPVLEKLAATRLTRRPVRILVIGDSHAAGDQITGAWRALLQARYGNAGRGVLPPGRPYQGYLTRDVTAAASPGWAVAGIFGAAYKGGVKGVGAPPIGISGYSLTSPPDGGSLSIAADAVGFDRFTVCALAQPGAGTLTLRLGDTIRPVPLAADRIEPRCASVDAPAVAYTGSLTVAGGPATITSWATERSGAGGVILSNLGTVGAQLMHLDRIDERVAAAEIAEYRPDLLVVEFGTNEAFMPRFAAAVYDNRLRAGIARLKRWMPGVPILILGAPDSATRQAALQVGESGTSPPCPVSNADLPPAASAVTGDQPVPGFVMPDGWRPTAALVSVQAVQRRVAHDQGLAFWDWSARMGGRCSASRWVGLPTPLMRGDHVHFTSAGGAEIARRLQADLDAAAALDAAPSR